MLSNELTEITFKPPETRCVYDEMARQINELQSQVITLKEKLQQQKKVLHNMRVSSMKEIQAQKEQVIM
jgi:hypothetical protein